MELIEGIETRRSLRAFRSTPVAKGVLEKILAAAAKSPSYTNTQPWEVAVVCGEKKEELSRVLSDLAGSDTLPNSDVPLPENWPAELEQRSREHGKRRLQAIGVNREDVRQRKELRLANFKFYGAPCILILLMDSTLGPWSIFDMGLFSQTLILIAHSFGVGSCLQASVSGYPDTIREVLGVPKTKKVVLAISMGYPDLGARINNYHSTRVSPDDFAQWYT